jgi:hypothetical protein
MMRALVLERQHQLAPLAEVGHLFAQRRVERGQDID